MSVVIHTKPRRVEEQVENILSTYDMDATARFLSDKQQVVLQLPDELLRNSTLFLEALSRVSPNTKCRVMADTTFSRCCVDEVTAEHLPGVHGILHVGPSCASKTSRVPVFHIPQKCSSVQLSTLREEIQAIAKQHKTVAVVIGSSLRHYADELSGGWDPSQVVVGPPNTVPSLHWVDVGIRQVPMECPSYYLASLEGSSDGCLVQLGLLSAAQGVPLYVTGNVAKPLDTSVYSSRLRQRNFLTTKILEANAIGIVVCTLSIDGTNDVTRALYDTINSSGKRAYILFIGKLNVPKISNFVADIDLFVMIGCPNHSILTSLEMKEYPKPIVTPMEIFAAFESDTAAHKLLKTSCAITSVTYARNYVMMNAAAQATEGGDASTNSCTTLAVAPSLALSTISRIQQRSYNGLDPRLGQTEVQEEVPVGKEGIAKGYTHEAKNQEQN
eukprot:PhF_6_TR12899/c0_g1_i1/m.20312/K17866/DPH2; diphthamide biosynthesis protein 2